MCTCVRLVGWCVAWPLIYCGWWLWWNLSSCRWPGRPLVWTPLVNQNDIKPIHHPTWLYLGSLLILLPLNSEDYNDFSIQCFDGRHTFDIICLFSSPLFYSWWKIFSMIQNIFSIRKYLCCATKVWVAVISPIHHLDMDTDNEAATAQCAVRSQTQIRKLNADPFIKMLVHTCRHYSRNLVSPCWQQPGPIMTIMEMDIPNN